MQFLLDHLASVAIAGLLMLVIVATQFRGRDGSQDATQYYDARMQLLTVVQSIERDFTNIGSGVDTVAYAITGFDTTSTPATFTFQARTDSAIATPQTIVYEWEPEGTVKLKDNTTVPSYTIRRKINGAVSGQSVGALTKIRIDLLTADSLAVYTNYHEVRLINVALKTASKLGDNQRIEQSSWDKSFRPINLTRSIN